MTLLVWFVITVRKIIFVIIIEVRNVWFFSNHTTYSSYLGTAGGGHYTAYALNNIDQEWYEYDDSYVTKVEAATVMNAEAYVLFYRKNGNMEPLREELQTFLEQQAGLVKFYISRQWLNKFENFAEPGTVIDKIDIASK